MRQIKSSSFQFFEPDQIEQADVVEQLISFTRGTHTKSGCETWACAWAPDNSYFAWSSGQHILHLIPWNSGKQKRHNPCDDDERLDGRSFHILDCGENIWSVAFGSGYSHGSVQSQSYRHCCFDQSLILATGLANGRINLWNCHTGALIIDLLDHRDTVRCLDFTRDGSLQLLSASHDGSIKLWDLYNEGNMYSTFKAQRTMFYSCRFSPNGRFIAAVGSCKLVFLWTNVTLKHQPYRLKGHFNEVVSCDFSPDSALLVTAAYDTKIIIWDTHSLQELWTFGHLHPSPSLIFAGGANDHYVRGVTFSRNGLVFASICDDGYARYWSIEDLDDPVAISAVGEPVSCQFSPDGSVLAVGLRNGDVKFLSTPTSVPSLLHIARQAIRKNMNPDSITSLPIPRMLSDYLKYYSFVQDNSSRICC